MPQKTPQTATRSSILSPYNVRVKCKAGDNWLVPGRKGSGKTTFTKELVTSLSALYPTSRIYVLDIKFRDFNDWPGIIQSERAPKRPDSNDRVQIWQPLKEDPEEIERWLYGILHDPPSLLDIDELLALCYGRKDTSDMFKRIQKLGRALPVGTVVSTQELVEIPRNAIGQHDHLVRFRLKHPYERTLMKQMMGEHAEPTDLHGFYYQNADEDSYKYFRDYHSFF